MDLLIVLIGLGEQILSQLGTDNPGNTNEQRAAFDEGLRTLVQKAKEQQNTDLEQVAAAIVAYRSTFVANLSRGWNL